MNQKFNLAAVLLMLIAVGLVVISFVQRQSKLGAKQETTAMLTILPTALVGFPDIEHIPVYPGATVTFTKTDAAKPYYVSYQVEAHMDEVTKFYRDMLPKLGWLLKDDQGLRTLYSWTDPEGNLLWQMYLQVTLGLTLDGSKATVNLEYGRYPNTERGLPLYPDAQQVSVTRSNVEKSFTAGRTPVNVANITYLSDSTPQEIAAFYTNCMQGYGWDYQKPGWSTREYSWFPFDDPGSWEGYNPQEGLYFVAWRPTWGKAASIYSYNLLATAIPEKDGGTLIKLHIEEMESSLSF